MLPFFFCWHLSRWLISFCIQEKSFATIAIPFLVCDSSDCLFAQHFQSLPCALALGSSFSLQLSTALLFQWLFCLVFVTFLLLLLFFYLFFSYWYCVRFIVNVMYFGIVFSSVAHLIFSSGCLQVDWIRAVLLNSHIELAGYLIVSRITYCFNVIEMFHFAQPIRWIRSVSLYSVSSQISNIGWLWCGASWQISQVQ